MNLLELPHFHAPGRPFMSGHDRAAQFMPFKSLTGFDSQIDQKTSALNDVEWENVIYDDEYDGLDSAQVGGDDDSIVLEK